MTASTIGSGEPGKQLGFNDLSGWLVVFRYHLRLRGPGPKGFDPQLVRPHYINQSFKDWCEMV